MIGREAGRRSYTPMICFIKCQNWFVKHGAGRIGAPEANRKALTDSRAHRFL